MIKKQKEKGVTLIEMLLVLVIMASIFYMLTGYVTQRGDEIRRDRVSTQMIQILNAAMTYYINNSFWPVQIPGQPLGSCASSITSGGPVGNLDILTSGSTPYLRNIVKNPWGGEFKIGCDGTTGTFMISSSIPKKEDALIVAGRVPSGGIIEGTGTDTLATSTISIPGQNLNNARSVNYAGMYRSGACVPAPNCPTNMKPIILVVPAGVSGINEYPAQLEAGVFKAKVNAITSFTAFARGDRQGNPTLPGPPGPGYGPQDCSSAGRDVYPIVACNTGSAPLTDPPTTRYWRVCLKVETVKGDAYPANPTDSQTTLLAIEQGKMLGAVLAVTRCVPANSSGSIIESPTGSDFNVFTPNESYTP